MIQQPSSDFIREPSISSPSYLTVLKALLTKNLLIIKDNRSKYAFIWLSPILILLLILLLQNWANSNFIWQNLNPDVIQIPKIPKCFGQDCVTLAYAINGDEHPYIEHTMQHVKKKNNLTDLDVKKWDMNLNQAMKKIKLNPNKTQALVVFCTNGFWEYENYKIPCSGEDYHLNTYTIIFNLTLFHRVPFFSNLKGAYPKDMVTVKLKKDIDEGVIDYYNRGTFFNITTSDFPAKNSRFVTGFSIFAQYGSFFIMIPYLVLMVMEGSQQLKQKQDRLRIGLNIVGVSHLQFYLSQIIMYFISVVLISVSFCIGGLIFDIKFWSNALLWFDFTTLVLNGLTIGLVAFCITALVSNKNLGMSLIYGFVLYSIVMQWLFSGGYILQLLYMDTASSLVKILKGIFNLYPSYHFTKIFADVSRTADSHFDTLQNRYVEGRPFTYSDLFFKRSQSFKQPFPRSYTLPSCIQSLFYMFLVTCLYSFVILLLDRYIESNRGYTEPLFPKRNRKNSQYARINMGGQNQTEPMVEVVNLQKNYGNKVHALRGVSVQLKKGEIVSLLGENGAGKSTLINILVGALSLSRGSLTVDGKNVVTQINQIRKVMGVCPQFDILWDQMTAQQHIKMFCCLKGCPDSDLQIKRSLQSVRLYENKNGKVKTFSGGMRRRLSLAISLIGNPKLVVMDEPTTGMDAKIRLQTWKIILKLRDPNRTMLITTHNMQQSECLSDRILVMSKGKIVAKGTTVQLKQQYGQGYLIHGIDQKGQNISFKCKEAELEDGLRKIADEGLGNWSLQQTTLQQVFLSINDKY